MRPAGRFGYLLRMAALTVDYPDDLLLTSGKDRREVENELRLQLAARLFEIGHLSLGKAAELAGLIKPRFAEALGKMKIPVISLDEQELQAEIHALRGDDHCG